MNKKNLLSITDLTSKDIWEILTTAKKLKKTLKNTNTVIDILKNKSMVMIFEKPSLRTKLSFDIGMNKLGGHSVYFGSTEVGLGARESVPDLARVVSSMGDILVVRTFKHETLAELVKYSTIPVINALSDLEHPCQTLADLLTIWECKKDIKDLKIAYVGDGENNVPHSLCLGAAMLGLNFSSACPKGFWMNRQIVTKAQEIGIMTGAKLIETEDPVAAVLDADIVYTDTWVSMGKEDEKQERLKVFAPYQVTGELMKSAKKDAIFMHDLPAYREREVTIAVIDGNQSIVFQQAENRMWAQMALIVYLLEAKI